MILRLTLLLSVFCLGAALPPKPPSGTAKAAMAVTRRSAAVHQGRGALDLVMGIKIAVAPAPVVFTNRFWLTWPHETNEWMNGTYVVTFCAGTGIAPVDRTKFYEIQSTVGLPPVWRIEGATNRPPWPVVSTNSSLFFRVREFYQ